MNLEQASAAIGAMLDADVPAFLWGAPGIGKSDVVRAVGAARSLPVIDFRAILRDPVDLRGLPDVSGESTIWKRPSDLPFIGNTGPDAGILFMDELNAAAPSMQAACFGLVLDRKVGEHVLKPGWRIVAAGNRQSDKAAAQRMPSALANRFAHLDVHADPEAWAKWAAADGNVHAALIAFIRFRPGLLHVMPGGEADATTKIRMPADARAFPTPRSWVQAGKFVDATSGIRLPLITANVGDGPAAEFEGFIRTFLSLPSIRDIFADPDGARVPPASEPATLYAAAAAVARKATAATFGAALRYAARLPKEFEILCAVDAVRRDPSLTETAAYTGWIGRNADVLI